MTKTIKLNLKERSYPIVIVNKGFKPLIQHIKKMHLGQDAVIITNSNIAKLYGRDLRSALNKAKVSSHFIHVKDSEKSKSISESIKVIKQISKLDTKKRLFLIALGGGVVGDLCGFVAATYKRGVNYIQIPTTLLAQVDSAIGGKTAIDLPSGKNLVGAFFQPRLVYSNIDLLKSLPKRQIKSGLAELVKYGVIADKKLFAFLSNNYNKLLRLDAGCLLHVICAASRIKARIVEIDEKETKGLRTILNFGHTIGHALEAATKYSQLNHGEAISIGMVAASEIALNLGLLGPKTLNTIEGLLKSMQLPVRARQADFKAVLGAFYRDKKFIHAKIRMVLPTRIGHVIVTENIPALMVKNIIRKRAV